MKNILLLSTIVIIVLFWSACKQGVGAPPIHRDKMVQIMTDIHLAEVYSTMVNDSAGGITNKNMDSLAVYYSKIFKSHEVTEEDFKESMDWYTRNVTELDTVYINMLSELSTKEGVLSASDAGKKARE